MLLDTRDGGNRNTATTEATGAHPEDSLPGLERENGADPFDHHHHFGLSGSMSKHPRAC